MSDTMNEGTRRSRNADDPFAELFEAIEREAPSAPTAAREPGRAAPASATMERASPQAPSPDYPASSLAAGRSSPRLQPRRPFYSEDEQSELGIALSGLCEPATPRLSGPVETARCAPDRFTPVEETSSQTVLDDFDELIASELAVLRPAPLYAQPETYETAYAPAHVEQPYETPAYDAPAHEPAYDDAAYAHSVAPTKPASRRHVAANDGGRGRRLLFLGGGVAAVALVAVFGVAMSGGIFAGGLIGDGEPVLIRADAEPVKMQPTEPGGRVVPNQNKAVYERVARNGGAASPAAQPMLISAAEEPLDISFEDEVSNLPGVMVGTSDIPSMETVQVAEAASSPTSDAVSSVLQPHRVRTYEVRPDGTLVPRTDPVAPAEAPAASDPVEAMTQPALPTGIEAPVATDEVATPPAAEPVAPAAPEAPPAADVAAVEAPAAPAVAVPSDAFFVQISSQPSEALAQESMATLANRFASAIGGRQLTIQSAEIDGRGTFHRVRVVTATREEANSVCANLQSAGGSCFVTR